MLREIWWQRYEDTICNGGIEMNRIRAVFIGVLVLFSFVVVGGVFRIFGITTETTTVIAKWTSGISAVLLLFYSVFYHYWYIDRK